MILQYYVNDGECYYEAETIGLYEIDISGLKEKLNEKILEYLVNKVLGCVGNNIIDVNDILSDKIDEGTNGLKVAILSDGEEKKNNKVLLFANNSVVYLLNNSGKTIRKF